MRWQQALGDRIRSILPGFTRRAVARSCQAYREYLQAKRAWFVEFERLAIEAAPEAGDAIRNRFGVQLAHDERSLACLEYLAVYAPARVRLARGLSEITASLASTDTASLGAAGDSRVEELDAEIAHLQSEPHPSIRAALLAEARPEYREALAALRAKMRELDARLGKRAA